MKKTRERREREEGEGDGEKKEERRALSRGTENTFVTRARHNRIAWGGPSLGRKESGIVLRYLLP